MMPLLLTLADALPWMEHRVARRYRITWQADIREWQLSNDYGDALAWSPYLPLLVTMVHDPKQIKVTG
jgi:hypothetical protein